MGKEHDEITEEVLGSEGEKWNQAGCLPCGIVFNRMKAYHEADMVRLMFSIGALERKVRKLEERHETLLRLEKWINKQDKRGVRASPKVQGDELQRGAVQPEIPSKYESDMLDVPPRH